MSVSESSCWVSYPRETGASELMLDLRKCIGNIGYYAWMFDGHGGGQTPAMTMVQATPNYQHQEE